MRYTEEDILEYFDGQFDDKQTAEFLSQLRTDPELAELAKAMQASQVPIELAYQQAKLPPVPESLRVKVAALSDAASQAPDVSTDQRPVKKWSSLGLVASLVCGIGLGAVVMQQVQTSLVNGLASPQASTNNAQQTHLRLVKRIADYQSLYIENTVANLSTTRVQDAQRLLEKIQSNDAVSVGIPDFSEFGYDFARAQELGFEGDTLIQLVYRKPGFPPLAFCYMRSANTPPQELQLSQYHHLQSASWVSDSQHYVLLADEPNAILEQMHTIAVATF